MNYWYHKKDERRTREGDSKMSDSLGVSGRFLFVVRSEAELFRGRGVF